MFLHGGGPGCSAWTDFGPVAPLFAEARRCHLVDLLQYGKSDKSPISGPRWSYLAASLVELLDALGEDRVDLVCNSWGGTIAIAAAAEFPDRVRSLVVTGSMPVFSGPLGPLPEGGRRGRNARDAYFGGEGPTLAKMRHLMATLEWADGDLIPPETVRLRHEQSLEPGEMHLAAQSDALRGDWQDLAGHLRRIRCRALFCWGMADAFLTPDYPLMLANMVPHGQLYVMDRDVAPPPGGAALGLLLGRRRVPRPVGAGVVKRLLAAAVLAAAAWIWRAKLVGVLTATTGTWVGSPASPRSERPQAPQ